MQFSPLTLDCYPVWKSFWDKTPVRTADTTFVNLYGWALAYELEYAVSNDLFWVRKTRTSTGIPTLWMPLGDTANVAWDEALASFPAGTRFERIPEALAKAMKGSSPRIGEVTATRGEDEYLYAREALAKFEGRKLHKKRSHINAFERLYGVCYRNLTAKDTALILALSEKWLESSPEQSESLLREHAAIKRMLSLWDLDGSIRAGGLFHEGNLIAYDFGSAVTEEMFVVHIEKGLPEYRGVYPSIVKNFAEFGVPESYRFINREQDLDDEGLRYSKMTYNPVDFIKKDAFTLR
jgi:uncharacterized protein